jgi:hypothetical protein
VAWWFSPLRMRCCLLQASPLVRLAVWRCCVLRNSTSLQ